MDTIYKGLCLLSRALRFCTWGALAARCHELGYAAVGKEHELFDEPVCFLCHLLIYVHRTALFIHLNLHFRALEADCACCKSLFAELCREGMEGEDCVLDICRNLLMGLYWRVDDLLRVFVCKSMV